MPPSSPSQPLRLAHTTPFPNTLLDEVMPELSGAQWCVLCVVVRQTLGWKEKSGGRKARDWMTHHQLKRRTGLASASVSHAIETLVRRGLIEVQDESGQMVDSPAQRRRTRGALYFSLGHRWLEPEQAQKGDTEKSKGAEATSQSGFQKVKTTKETVTKEGVIFKKRKADDVLGSAIVEDALSEISADAQRFLALFEQKYREHPGSDSSLIGGKTDGAKVQELLCQHTVEELTGLLDAFFTNRSRWITAQGHSLRVFLHSVHILKALAQAAKNAAKRPRRQ